MEHCNIFLCAAIISILSGCAIQPAVKDVLINPQAYLNTNFSETRLSDSVRNTLGINSPGNVKRQVIIDMAVTNIENETQTIFNKIHTYDVLDNGLVRSLAQASINGIPALTEFKLDYYVFPLMYQSVSHGRGNANMPRHTKTISNLDKGIANPKELSEYVFEFARVPEIQIMNFNSQKIVCKSGKWVMANTIHAKLTGTALPFDCKYFGTNGQLFATEKSVFIKNLGIIISQESASTSQKHTYKVNDVN